MPAGMHAEDGPLPRGHRGRMCGLLLVMLFCVALSVDFRLVDGRVQICGHRGLTHRPDLARVDSGKEVEPSRPP